ncbi:MAG: hexose kinase [Atopobiaceae bacterium]|jgi:1-phosphofructokinase/6-phosphofructokinase 2|nr:hexose kinase [Atopobiaceae bacterium]MCI2174197.1 hexose kinase [Atopobiaceae bacterium]MCI2206838.1 hexose kinase [Atopobiaceae bacterium]
MIYTLTTNPAIDMNISCDGLVADKVCRTRDAVYTPNGKGLNVSFTLKHYGVDSTILGFFGGFTGDFIVSGAKERGCEVMPVMIDGITRVNVFLSDFGNGCEYTLPNAGAPVCRDKQLELLDLLDGLDDLECLIVSGSLSPQIEPSYYEEIISHVKAKGAEFVLDISHPSLAQLVSERPLIIKPNDEEVAAIFGVDVDSERSMVEAMRIVHERGAQNILLTLGGAGAYFYNGERMWHASAAKVKILSTACAGDATLASFLSIWYSDRDAVEPALRRAMATGGNVAMSAGLGTFDKVDEIARQIEIEEIPLG